MRGMIVWVFLFCMVGCKTYRQTEIQNDIRKEWEGEYLSSSLSNVLLTGSGKEKFFENLSGSIRVWSPPDSQGKQYPVADIDFNRETIGEKEGSVNVASSDSTYVHGTFHGSEEDHSTFREVKKTDSRIFGGKFIAAVIVILAIGVLIFLLKKRNQHQ